MKSQKSLAKGQTPTDLRRERFVDGLVDGKSMRQAALDAGYAETTANVACRDIMPQTRDAFRRAMHQRISIGKLSDTITAGLDAKETKFFAHKGEVIDKKNVIAWSERREYAKLAANLMSFEPPKEVTGADGGPLEFLLVTEHVGRTR